MRDRRAGRRRNVADLTFGEVKAILRDPGLRVRACLSRWEDTRNPVFLWEAIAVCAEHHRPPPTAVMSYLGDVARRILSDEARTAKDLGRTLPKVLGFHKGPGPGRLLDPEGDPDDLDLAVLFATELELGHAVPEALKNATGKLPAHFGDYDERTLKKRIANAAGLQTVPRDAAQWRTQLRASIGAFLDLIRDAQ